MPDEQQQTEPNDDKQPGQQVNQNDRPARNAVNMARGDRASRASG